MKFTDDIGYQLSLEDTPRRIISLVPSQTELLFDLGLDDEVVGLTKFCIHPKEKWQSLPRVGGTKQVDMERIRSLQPDLIICNKEENTLEIVQNLQREYNVYTTDVNTLDQALAMIRNIGEIVGKGIEANELADQIFKSWDSSRELVSSNSVLYVIWNDPIMVAARHTFIHSALTWFGWTNAADDLQRYPELKWDEIIQMAPKYVFLSSEPFPFREQHLMEWRERLPQSKIVLVDGEAFSWYGSRLLKTPSYIEELVAQLDRS